METNIQRWVVEFLLRQPIEEHIIHPFLNVLALSDDDHRLMKTGLLRRIALEISNCSVSENTLDSLEMIEQCDFENGVTVLGSMWEAYCAVAVHCTVRCLKEKSDDFRSYLDSVIKIWRGRVRDMENRGRVGVFQEQLKHSGEMIEEVLWNASVRDKILRRDTLGDALKALRVFLAEVIEEMGPCFLETLGKTMNDMAKEVHISPAILLANQIGRRQVGSADVPPKSGNDGSLLDSRRSDMVEVIIEEIPSAKGMDPSLLEVAASTGNGKQTEVCDPPDPSLADQTGERQMFSTDAPTEGINVNSGNLLEHNSGHMAKDSVEEILSAEEIGSLHPRIPAKEMNCKGKHAQVYPNPSSSDQAGQNKEMNCKGKQAQVYPNPTSSDQAGQKHMFSADASSGSTDVRPRPCAEKYATKLLATPDVRKVQEALKSSTIELQAVARDPLPDALRQAATISSSLAREKTWGSSENRNVVDMNVGSSSSFDRVVEAIHVKEVVTGNQDAASRPSLLKRNSTACTFEWDDEEDPIMSSHEGSPNPRPHLPPIQRRRLVSPLKRYETGKIRRRGRRWSPEEEQALRDAVRECGRGNWKFILDQYGESFNGRTEVDLKDKWRNLTK